MSAVLAEQAREVEALVQLYREIEPRAPMPPAGGFALLDVLHLIRTRKPRLVVELGGGASTVWTAYALESTGGKLVSLTEEDAERTRSWLVTHGLTEVAEVREGELDVTDIDLLLVTGRPDLARKLVRRLADGATVVVGEAHLGGLETAEGLTREGEALGRHAVFSYRRVIRQLSRSQ
jgi:predicted O-methyltransferase YrrM